MADPKCRTCSGSIERKGGGWVHKDKSKTYNHPARPQDLKTVLVRISSNG